MKLVRRTPRYAVFDEVLDPSEQESVWRYVQEDRYIKVHQGGWNKAWRLLDGEPWGGTTLEVDVPPVVPSSVPATLGGVSPRVPIELLFRQLALLAGDVADLVGLPGRDYVKVTARPYLYPAGSAFSWHRDHGPYSGAYTFYAHPRWDTLWGGELMLTDPRPSEQAAAGPLDPSRGEELASIAGWGEYVSAVPNRLVVVKGGTPHRIARVDVSAGAHVRCSVSGFFVAVDAARQRS